MSIEETIASLSRSRWWYFASVLVPALIAGAGSIYIATLLASQKQEINVLREQLWETQQALDRCMGPGP